LGVLARAVPAVWPDPVATPAVWPDPVAHPPPALAACNAARREAGLPSLRG